MVANKMVIAKFLEGATESLVFKIKYEAIQKKYGIKMVEVVINIKNLN